MFACFDRSTCAQKGENAGVSGNQEGSGRTRLLSLASQNSFSWKLRAPMRPGEVRHIERWLATPRLALAISALFAIWMDATQIS
jgi:hypothetical protein